MPIELWPPQQVAVAKLGKLDLSSRLIGDEMGLGKTVTGLAIDDKLRGRQRRDAKTLIVAPLAVHDHWRKHVLRVVPGARVFVIDRKDRLGLAKALRQPYTHYIVHYEALRLKGSEIPIRNVVWFHIIADEVHRIKSVKAQQTRAIKALRTTYKTGLSGTPADNKPQDLYSILNWLWPKKYSSYWRYVEMYCQMETTEGKQGQTFRHVVGVNTAAIPELHREMHPYYIRRLKSAVLKDLPPKYWTERTVELPLKQRRMYDQMRKHMLAWVGEHEDQELSAPVVIAQLTRLQQFALATPEVSYKMVMNRKTGELERKMVVVLREPSAKLDDLEEVLLENINEPLVVFSQSRSMIDLVETRLSRHTSVGKYTGQVPQAVRDKNVELFQRGDLQVIALTIRAGGEGIELFRGSNVVFLDRDWSPSKNNQAEDRLHRFGQKNAVQVIDITARNTVDLGRRAEIASKWRTLKLLLGDTVDTELFEQENKAA